MRLLARRQVSQRSVFARRIKEQEPAQLRIVDDGIERLGFDRIRKPDCNNGVTEQKHRESGADQTTPRTNHYVVGFDSDLLQHGIQQRRLVLTVAVTMRQYVCCSVWLVASNTDLDGGIANLPLRKRRQRPDLFQRIGNAGGELHYLSLDFRRELPPGSNQAVIPKTYVVP